MQQIDQTFNAQKDFNPAQNRTHTQGVCAANKRQTDRGPDAAVERSTRRFGILDSV
jgi:hypothetical protein